MASVVLASIIRGSHCFFKLVLVLALTVYPTSAQRGRPEEPDHLLLGNPSKAKSTGRNRNNFLLLKPQFSLSYNNSRGGPNWVSWHLEKADLGRADRSQSRFHPDFELPQGFVTVKYSDYSKTGFDSGHLCNSEDRTNTKAANAATFAMTNMLPQAPSMNRGPWKSLEAYERKLARGKFELYIIAGAYGSGGDGVLTLSEKASRRVRSNSIRKGTITVPKIFWKVMVIIPNGINDLLRIDKNTRTIAVCMPNSQRVAGFNWRYYITTIDNVEAATGYDFFSKLSSHVQNAIERRRDSEAWGKANVNPCVIG